MGDSSAISCSTIEAQKDAGCGKEMWERRAFISLSLDPCQERILGGFFLVKDSVEELVRVGQWVEGKIKVMLDEMFEFENAPEAYRKLRTGRARGKIVVHVTERPEVGL